MGIMRRRGGETRATAWQVAVFIYLGTCSVLGLKGTLGYAPSFIRQLPDDLQFKFGLAFAGIGAVFVGVALSGWLVIKAPEVGIRLSRMIFVLQIPVWFHSRTGYEFVTGLFLDVGWYGGGPTALWGWRVALHFGPSADFDGPYYGVNMLAVALVALLGRVKADTKCTV